jgi:hypothetical protein
VRSALRPVRVPGAREASFVRSALRPVRDPRVAYVCHGAVRTKLPRWAGAQEVEGGLVAWRRAGLPLDRRERSPTPRAAAQRGEDPGGGEQPRRARGDDDEQDELGSDRVGRRASIRERIDAPQRQAQPPDEGRDGQADAHGDQPGQPHPARP